MGDKRNFAALEWVIGEISETLKDARQALESFVEDPRDSTRMRFCLTHIHQVFGSLQMVEFHGASLLAEEMEHTAQAIINNDVSSASEAQEVLMRAMLQLPIYLDHIKTSKEDHPGAVLPLLNDLRAVRKKSFLSETNLFLPNLDAASPRSQPLHQVTKDPKKLAGVLKKLREMYQFAAASVLRGVSIDENLTFLEKVVTRLELITRGTQCHATWDIALALIDALKRDDLELSVAVRGLLRYLARELRLISENAPQTFNRKAPESLLKNLLYYVSKAGEGSEKVAKICTAYELDAAEFNKSGDIRGGSVNNMSAPDPEAIKSVVVALQEELNTIKHVLDLAVKGQASVQNLAEILPVVKRVGDTLAVLGIGDLRKRIVEQIALIDDMIENNALNEEQLYSVASKVIDVEHKLDAISKVVGKGSDLSSINEREIEIDHAKETVIIECRKGLERAKDAIIEYVSSNWDKSYLENIDQLLRDIRGGLDIIPLPRPAAIMESCNRFIQEGLLSGSVQPSWERMETLADAMASVEYYLERLSSNIDNDADSLLNIAEESVDALGYPLDKELRANSGVSNDSSLDHVPPTIEVESLESDEEYEARAAKSDLSTTDAYDQLSHASSLTEEEPAPITEEEPASIEPSFDSEQPFDPIEPYQEDEEIDIPTLELDEVEASVDLTDAFKSTNKTNEDPISLDRISVTDDDSGDESDIDDEIIEIFIEEAGEVLETLHEYFPKWRANNADNDSLVIVRRAFHTLKGSGRMVEALEIGELAWSVENMLNRLIDKSISYSDSQCDFIARVMKFTPHLVTAFEKRQPNPDKPLTEYLMKLGDELSEGNTISDFSFVDDLLSNIGADHGAPPEDTSVVGLHADQSDINTDISSDLADDEEDSVLIEIFVSESRSHLHTMQLFVSDMRAIAPIFTPPTDSLQRALHTLKGSAKMANKMAIAHMSEPLEEFAKELITYQVSIDSDILQLLSDATAYMETAIDVIELKGNADIPKLDQFLARLNELRERAVGSLIRLKELEKDGANVVDPRLLSIFMAEEMTLLLDADSTLNQWRGHESGPQLEKIDEFIKELATLKEGANKANLPDMQELSDILKSVHEKVKASELELNEHFFECVIAGHNALLDMVDAVAAGQNVLPPNQDIINALKVLINAEPEILNNEESRDNLQKFDISEISTTEYNHQEERVEEEDLDGGLLGGDIDLDTEQKIQEGFGESENSLDENETAQENEQTVDVESTEIENLSTDSIYLDAPNLDILEVENLDNEDPETESISLQDLSDDPIDEAEISLIEGLDTAFDGDFSNLEENVIDEDLEADLDDALTSEESSIPREYLDVSEIAQEEANEPVTINENVITDELQLNELNQDSNIEQPELVNVETITEPAHVTPEENIVESEQAVILVDDTYDIVDFSSSDFDQDIFEVFIEEAEELSEELDEAIHAWREDWSDEKPSDILKRALHTLKGGARLANLDKLGDLTHEYETYIITTKFDDVDDAFFENLQVFQDDVLKHVKVLQQPVADAPSFTLEPAANIQPSTPITSENSNSANVVPFAAPKPSVESDLAQHYSGPVTASSAVINQAQTAAKRAGPQEVVKVPADLLEELVNLAGETSISRGRLEQQVTDFGHALEEVDGTIVRLQEQIRRLDIETEAQILFRQEQIAESDRNFDPLEMDRYSQLQQLSRSLIESASDLVDLRGTLTENVRDTETLLLQQSRINSNLQEGLMRSRMVPFSRMVPRLRRIVRQVAAELGKNVSFELDNIEGELDRSVLERMVAPLEHMLRNAVDHGIESPDERVDTGKSDTGRIILSLGREGGEVILKLADDGRGINLDRVREKAIERNLMAKDAELSDLDVMQFILHAGFSTAENVTQISGRGVGMDVVNAEIKQLGGSVSINSQWGKGTEFYVRLPFTVSVNRALMVELGNDHYAVPLNSIEGIVRVSPFELEHYYQNPDARFEYAGENYQVRYLGSMLSRDQQPKLEGQSLSMPVLLVRSAEHTMAFQVDTLLGSREIVVKNLGQQFSSVQGLSGATLMGDGSVVVILDPHAIVRKEMSQTGPTMTLISSTDALPEPLNDVHTVMVVDDSVTVRKVTTRFLERQGYNVITAKDGVDALRILQDETPDLMLLDIEMPRMDGFEVAKNIRTTSRWKHIPIIMITSRTGDKHREHAFSLGVNDYLGKPYQEEVLLESITDILGDASQ